MSWLRWTCWHPFGVVSRQNYIRRRLAQDARTARVTVAASDWCGFAGNLPRSQGCLSYGSGLGLTRQAWLIDKSALVRIADGADLARWNNRIERGLVHIANLTRLGSAIQRVAERTPPRVRPISTGGDASQIPRPQSKTAPWRFRCCSLIAANTAHHRFRICS